MIVVHGQYAVSVARPARQALARVATTASRREHTGVGLSAMPFDLGTRRWLQSHRSGSIGPVALHQRSYVGEAVRDGRRDSVVGSTSARATASVRQGHRDAHYPGRNLSPNRSRLGVHHVVAGEAGRAPSFAQGARSFEPRNHSSSPSSPWTALSNRTDLVRERRPGFRGKKNAIIRLYRNPPRDGPVVCFDELGPLQTIPRGGRSWAKKAALRADRYSRRHGTLQFFAAFCPRNGLAAGRGAPNKSSSRCRDFLREVVLKTWRRGRIHLILDNLSAHKAPAVREWAAKHRKRIKFHWLPTNSSWLNLVESYFATLERTALHNTHYRTPREIERGLARGMNYLNHHPRPYLWRKL